jgi:hypothetical protein
VLRALLRSPKTREGLVAAAKAEGVTQRYVWGFISAGVADGSLVVNKLGTHRTYTVDQLVVAGSVMPSIYPAWLDPRTLPTAQSRRVIAKREMEDL